MSYFGGTRLFLSLKIIPPWPPREDKFWFWGRWKFWNLIGWGTDPHVTIKKSLNPVETASSGWTAPLVLGSWNFNKKRLQHSCFPVNIAKFLRALIWKWTSASKRCFENFCKICRKTTGPEPLFNNAAALHRSLMNQCQCWITPKTDLLYPN